MSYKRPTPPLLPLPPNPLEVWGRFWRYNPTFVNDLAVALKGKRVLEIFAGNGYLAGLLAERGIDVLATSILSGMDAHEMGVYHPIIEVDAVTAVATLSQERDVLLMCWPTTHRHSYQAAQLWSHLKSDQGMDSAQIAFIGEYTDYSKNHFGGCSTDEFFESFSPNHTFGSYQGNCMEKACLGTLKLPEPVPESYPDNAPAP